MRQGQLDNHQPELQLFPKKIPFFWERTLSSNDPPQLVAARNKILKFLAKLLDGYTSALI